MTLPNTPFASQIITKKEFGTIFGPASMHAIGHIAANLSFAAVAISLTHTVKTLEPAFNVVLMKLILGESTPLPAVLSLVPIIVRGQGIYGEGCSCLPCCFLTMLACPAFRSVLLWHLRASSHSTGWASSRPWHPT